MGGQPRFCEQCGTGLRPGTRFCGDCGHATAPADADAAVASPSGLAAREIDVPTRGAEAQPGLPSPRPASPWESARVETDTSVSPGAASRDDGYRDHGYAAPARDAGYPAPLSDPGPLGSPGPLGDPGRPAPFPNGGQSASGGYATPPSYAAPPSFATPPTGPAYPPPPAQAPLPAPPLPASPLPPPPDSSTLTGPAYPPTAAAYPPPPSLAAPPRGRPTPPPPGTPYAPPSAQYALPAGPSTPPPPSGETAQFGSSWMEEVGFNPQWEQAALPSITDARPGDDRPRQRKPLVIGLFVLVAAVLVVPALLVVHAIHGLGGGSHAAATKPATSQKPTQSAGAAATTEQATASALAALLAQSVTDRDKIVSAVGAVNNCSSGLSQAPQAFQNAAAGRQRLLQQLAQLSGRSKLPAAMLQSLTGAWQASAAVDQDLGKWAQDEVSKGCAKQDHNDANFQASNTPDVQATNDKGAFVGAWNQVAAKYGLTRYTTGQL